MEGLISRQPNGLLCIYEPTIHDVTYYNLWTDDEYVELCVEQARIEAKDRIENPVQPFNDIEQSLWGYPSQAVKDQVLKELSQPRTKNQPSYNCMGYRAKRESVLKMIKELKERRSDRF